MLVLIIADVLFYAICVAYKSSINIEEPGFIHLSLFSFFIICAVFPAPILFHRTRLYFVTCLVEIFKTPFVDVVFEHFFIADQLTSCGVVLLDIQYALAFYGTGDFITHGNKFLELFVD
jgi:hypothetical protein